MFEKLTTRIKRPTYEEKLTIYSDGNDDYEYVLPEFYSKNVIDYGQLVKIREKGKVIDKIKKVIYGTPSVDDIETTDVENFNGILRERIGRLVRKTKCFTKKKQFLEKAINIFQFYWNTMSVLPKKQTPAIMEGLTDHIWNWREFFYFN